MKSVSGSDTVLNNLISVLSMWNRVKETTDSMKKLFEKLNYESLCDVLFYEMVLSNTKVEDFLEDILQYNILYEHVTSSMKEQMIKMKGYVEKLNSNWPYLKFIIGKCHLKYYNAIIPKSNVECCSYEKVEKVQDNEIFSDEYDSFKFRNHIISNGRLSLISGTDLNLVDLGLNQVIMNDKNGIVRNESLKNNEKPYPQKNELVLNDIKSRVHINVDCIDFDKNCQLSNGDKDGSLDTYDFNKRNLANDLVISTNEIEKIEFYDILDYFIETDDEDHSGSFSDEYYEDTFSHYEEDEEEEFEEYDDISIEEIEDKYMNIYQFHGKNSRSNINTQRNNVAKVEETRSVEELLKFIEGDDTEKKTKPKKKKKKKKKKNKNKNTEKQEKANNNEDNTKKPKNDQETKAKKTENKEIAKNEKNGAKEKNNNNNQNNVNRDKTQSKEQQTSQNKEQQQQKNQKKSNNQQQNNKKGKSKSKNPTDDLLSLSDDDEEIESFLKKLQLGGIRESINKSEKKSNHHLENLAQWAREDRRNKFKFLYQKVENVKNSN